jgi:exosortase N
MHDVIGIASLILYVVVPMYFLSQYMIKKFGRKPVSLDQAAGNHFAKRPIALILAIAIVVTGVHINQKRSIPSWITHAAIDTNGFETVKMDDGITKMHNDKVLIYVKPIPEFFTGEHTPLLCWKGSGYEFGGITKTMIGTNEIYIGQLSKGDEVLFTAWWYSNGETVTIDQWDWRSRMFLGQERFCLINVTAESEEILFENVKSIFDRKWLAQQK